MSKKEDAVAPKKLQDIPPTPEWVEPTPAKFASKEEKSLAWDEYPDGYAAPKKTVGKTKPKTIPELIEDGNLIARYLEQHGQWNDHIAVNRWAGTQSTKVMKYCECDICEDALKELGLERT